jgi:predicted nucleic acid-binding protein
MGRSCRGADVASALSRLVRTKILSREDAHQRLADFDLWRLGATFDCALVAPDVDLAASYVHRLELMLRTPDALHVATCKRLGLVFVTLDVRLTSAARVIGLAVEVPRPPPPP